MDHHTKLSLAVLAHNLTPPAGSTIAPITAVAGKTDLLESIIWTPLSPCDAKDKSPTFQYWRRFQLIRKAQQAIIQSDAKITLQLCLKRRLQVETQEFFTEGDQVDLFLPKKRRWDGTYKVLHDSGRNIIIENNGKVWKHPKCWARLRIRYEGVSGNEGRVETADKDCQANNDQFAGSSEDPPMTIGAPTRDIIANEDTSVEPVGSSNGRKFSQRISSAELYPEIQTETIDSLKANRRRKGSLADSPGPSLLVLCPVPAVSGAFSNESLPIFCGFSVDALNMPRFCSNIFLADGDFSWDCSLRMNSCYHIGSSVFNTLPLSPLFLDSLLDIVFLFKPMSIDSG